MSNFITKKSGIGWPYNTPTFTGARFDYNVLQVAGDSRTDLPANSYAVVRASKFGGDGTYKVVSNILADPFDPWTYVTLEGLDTHGTGYDGSQTCVLWNRDTAIPDTTPNGVWGLTSYEIIDGDATQIIVADSDGSIAAQFAAGDKIYVLGWAVGVYTVLTSTWYETGEPPQTVLDLVETISFGEYGPSGYVYKTGIPNTGNGAGPDTAALDTGHTLDCVPPGEALTGQTGNTGTVTGAGRFAGIVRFLGSTGAGSVFSGDASYGNFNLGIPPYDMDPSSMVGGTACGSYTVFEGNSFGIGPMTGVGYIWRSVHPYGLIPGAAPGTTYVGSTPPGSIIPAQHPLPAEIIDTHTNSDLTGTWQIANLGTGNVASGETYGPNGALVGTLAAGDTQSAYNAGTGSQYTADSAAVLAIADSIKSTITVLGQTGTLTLPDRTQVLAGVTFGAAGADTGTLADVITGRGIYGGGGIYG